MSTRGIVTCAGGIRYLTCGWVLISQLRALGCRLPIEVWYSGESEEDCAWQELVRQLGVTLVDAQTVAVDHPHRRLAGWALKPYAILQSGFDEVLFLDADNVSVVDATYLFDEPEYHRTGTVFWPDGLKTPPESPRWKMFGVEYRDEPEQESGQILVDKSRCAEALTLCNWYNERAEFYYQHVHGDKDTFRFAWHRTNTPFAMPSKGPEIIPLTVCQHDFEGRRIFQHRAHEKWSLAGNRRVPGFVHEDKCLEFLAELDERWKPIFFLTKHIGEADRASARRLEGREYQFIRVGQNQWPVKLDDFGRIRLGQNRSMFYWWIESDRLIIADHEGSPSSAFASAAHGHWHGRPIDGSSFEVRLVPL